MVALDVCVKDRQGHPISGLAADDFLILDQSAPQKVAIFSPDGHVPLAVAVLLDRSNSMLGPRLERAKMAAAAFVRSLRPQDLVEVIAFDDIADRLFALGADHAAAERTIADVSVNGQTRLFEAVVVALRDLEHAQRARSAEYRNVIVILSDGEDTGSRLPFDVVLEDVRRSGVLVYGISLRTDERDRWLAPLRELAQLGYDTGGRAVAVRDLDSLAPVYEEIGAELRHLYRIGYVPSPVVRDGRWRSLSVRVARADARVRTRAGYYAPRPPRLVGHGPRP